MRGDFMLSGELREHHCCCYARISVLHCLFFVLLSFVFLPGIALASTQSDEVFESYQAESFTDFGLYQRVVKDLAYRWFNADSSKKSKVPLTPISYYQYKTLSQYVEEYQGADAQYSAFVSDFDSVFITQSYNLIQYENDMARWSVSGNYAKQIFGEWYDWFEGTSSGGGSSDLVPSSITMTCIQGVTNNHVSISGRTFDLSVTDTTKNALNNFMATNGLSHYVFVLLRGGVAYTYNPSSEALLRCYMSDEDITVTSEVIASNSNYDNLRVTISTQGNLYFWPNNRYLGGISNIVMDGDSVITSADTQDSTNVSILNSNTVVLTNPSLTSGQGSIAAYYTSGVVQGGGGSQTVFPVNPSPENPTTPTPPTLPNPVTYVPNDNTTTTVDLTPILEAIRILNNNVISGFQHIDNEFTTLFEWLGVISEQIDNWFNFFWEQFQSIPQQLDTIIELLSSQPYVDLPTTDGNNQSQQESVNIELLKRKFPVSIPWDLLAVLRLFEAPPTPIQFDFPVIMTEYTLHVDCSDWSSVAAISRRLSVLSFTVGLLWHSKKLLGLAASAGDI